MEKIRVALDWTPNTLHAPLLIAHSLGYYTECGLQVELISPSSDSYATTPAKKLVRGEVDLAICPSESVIAYAESKSSDDADSANNVQAIFALLSRDASTILCSRKSGIERPRDLDGKRYGSYNARYEDDIIRAMIRHDGGQGNIEVCQNLAKLDLLHVLTMPEHGKTEKAQDASQHIDATWIFHPWEGIKVKEMGYDGVEFNLGEYGIPYGYSPLIARNPHGPCSDESLAKFNQATRRAYTFVADNHEKSVQILQTWCPAETKEFLSLSLKDLQDYWGKSDVGNMNADKWTQFLTFLREEKLLKKDIRAADLYVNL